MVIGEISIENIKHMYIENVKNVKILDVVNTRYVRIDSLMIQQYGTMDYLPLVLAFNNIPDITLLETTDYLRLPDIFSLVENIELVMVDEMVPGVIELKPNKNKILVPNTLKNKNIGNAKLNLILEKVRYDSENGLLIY